MRGNAQIVQGNQNWNTTVNGTSGFTAALGTYETNGLMVTDDCPAATAIGVSTSEAVMQRVMR